MNRKLLVLLVEDNEVEAQLYSNMLETSDPFHAITCERCGSLAEAMARLENGDDVQAVLLDLLLPDATELEALRKLRRLHFELPIIVMSNIGPEWRLRVIAAGGCAFLAKPVCSGGCLVDTIRESVVRRELIVKQQPIHDSFEQTGRAISEARTSLALAKP